MTRLPCFIFAASRISLISWSRRCPDILIVEMVSLDCNKNRQQRRRILQTVYKTAEDMHTESVQVYNVCIAVRAKLQ